MLVSDDSGRYNLDVLIYTDLKERHLIARANVDFDDVSIAETVHYI